MRKLVSLKMLVAVAAFCYGGVLIAGYDDPAVKDDKIKEGLLSITKKDVDVNLGGRIASAWIGYDRVYTLQRGIGDQYSAFLSKSNLDLSAVYGYQTYGESAADAFLRLTNYGYWCREDKYTPFSDDSRSLSMLTFMEELWANVHLGTFFDTYDRWFSFKDHPVSIKFGYFPYAIGRGISYGGDPMNIPYLGWPGEGREDTRYNPAGILIHGKIIDDITYDLYYSKQSELLNPKDTELWTVKMDFNHKDKSWGDLHVQPYMMYIDASQTYLEASSDSSARLGTVGMMFDYKKGGFKVNAEMAGQFGHQNVYTRDRNSSTGTLVDTASGHEYRYHSHIFYGDDATAAYSKSYAPTSGSYNSNTGVQYNGKTAGDTYIIEYSSTTPSSGSNSDVRLTYTHAYNSNVTGNSRFRDEYRIDYRGFMGVVDMSYEFESVPVKIAGAGGYISGDKYPYNTEIDKRYKGFIPYGDHDYVGKDVKSHIVFESRKLSRPMDICYRTGYAFHNYDDITNLQYLGFSVDWKPLENKDTLRLESNLMWFWQTTTLKKWDKTKSVPSTFLGWSSWDSAKKGWESEQDASRMLGTEINFTTEYQPLTNCLFTTKLACFFPGQLYKDIEGMPDQLDSSYTGMVGLGHDPVFRVEVIFDYKF